VIKMQGPWPFWDMGGLAMGRQVGIPGTSKSYKNDLGGACFLVVETERFAIFLEHVSR
jgi:hypothetical protein